MGLKGKRVQRDKENDRHDWDEQGRGGRHQQLSPVLYNAPLVFKQTRESDTRGGAYFTPTCHLRTLFGNKHTLDN